MNTVNQKHTYRWVLLRHIGSPDDLRGLHFDLLVEDQQFCRTWRLSEIPLLDGSYVEAVLITPHKLDWLDIPKKVISGNRGVATRVKKGILHSPLLLNGEGYAKLSLIWDDIDAVLVIDKKGCRISRKQT